MNEPEIFAFNESLLIGKVTSVDTCRVLINAENSELVTNIMVGNLVGIQGSMISEYLIGIVERVTRSISEAMHVGEDNNSEEEFQLLPTTSDIVIVTLIGTFRTIDGSKRSQFKRGTDSFPQIDKHCYLINGSNLQRMMSILGSDLPEEQRLNIGRFSVDQNAETILNGDKFFQRHAAFLGSTGSGKSYAVALLLEKAQKISLFKYYCI